MNLKESNLKINIEVLNLPQASNLADFDSLSKEKDVDFKYIKIGEDPGTPDLLIIPGTKNTIQDLLHLKKTNYTDRIRSLARKRVMIMGICGGFQMLGTKIIDIKGSEFRASKCDGLSFFNIVTRLMPSKVDSRIEFETLENAFIKLSSKALSGYETHLGRTKYLKGSNPLFRISKRDGKEVEIFDGAVNERGNVLGTYIHGMFDNDSFRTEFLNTLRERKSL